MVTEKKKTQRAEEAEAVRARIEEESLIATERMARFLCFSLGEFVFYIKVY